MFSYRRSRVLCALCQCRSFSSSFRRFAEQAQKEAVKPNQTAAAPNSPPQKFIPPSPLEDAPRGYGQRVAAFTPVPLSRPIGMPYPPELGQNTGIDYRSLKQKRDDLVDWDKHLARREELKSKLRKPYFRDWTNLEHHKGKTFIAPPRLFRGELSLWFPNLFGTTLLKTNRQPLDTTPTLYGKVSVVTMVSGRWAEGQAKSFVGPEANPELAKLLQEHPDRAQLVQVNVEEDAMKAFLIRLFIGGLRKTVGEANWGRYFIVRRGISDEIRENIGLLNSKVGYVYLVDGQCRIRWAGSGYAEDHEREGLAKGLSRLLAEEAKSTSPGKK
ncbi:ATP10 protein-domain-containing protein [Xylariales sp. PMI_506]|nr:ATP10 protein-domain-containing protein [Xylariales sp. PMI_506]